MPWVLCSSLISKACLLLLHRSSGDKMSQLLFAFFFLLFGLVVVRRNESLPRSGWQNPPVPANPQHGEDGKISKTSNSASMYLRHLVLLKSERIFIFRMQSLKLYSIVTFIKHSNSWIVQLNFKRSYSVNCSKYIFPLNHHSILLSSLSPYCLRCT